MCSSCKTCRRVTRRTGRGRATLRSERAIFGGAPDSRQRQYPMALRRGAAPRRTSLLPPASASASAKPSSYDARRAAYKWAAAERIALATDTNRTLNSKLELEPKRELSVLPPATAYLHSCFRQHTTQHNARGNIHRSGRHCRIRVCTVT